MKLKYKISINMLIISLSILTLGSVIYSYLSYKSIMEHEKMKLTGDAIESSKFLEMNLLDRLSDVLTLATSPIVSESLQHANNLCDKLTEQQRNSLRENLNRQWMNAKTADDPFVKPYLNNELALFLKKQQTIFEGVYGEIFITNKYGAIISSTSKLTTLAHENKYWWKETYSSGKGKIFFDDRGFDSSVNDHVIGVVVPIKVEDKLIGILKANIKISSAIKVIVQNYNKANKSKLKIVRTKGNVVYEEGAEPLSTKVGPQVIKMLQNNETGNRLIAEKDEESLVSVAPLEINYEGKQISFGGKPVTSGSIQGNNKEIWHSVVSYKKEFILNHVAETNRLIIYIGLVGTVLTVLFAFYVGKWLSRPVEALALAHQQLQDQEGIIIAQSRHAAMGEMINMIAHQWRQPLSVISMDANNILVDIELGSTDEANIKKHIEAIAGKAQELSKTIDDFKNFFKSDKKTHMVYIKDIMDDVFVVVGASLRIYNIEIVCKLEHKQMITTYRREVMQVLINIIQNSKDAIIEQGLATGKIAIDVHEEKDKIKLVICDNGPGIEEDILDKVFDPYFSTKDKNGTGLGLYMSKVIIEDHLNGTISVYNTDDGVCFEISLPYKIEEHKA